MENEACFRKVLYGNEAEKQDAGTLADGVGISLRQPSGREYASSFPSGNSKAWPLAVLGNGAALCDRWKSGPCQEQARREKTPLNGSQAGRKTGGMRGHMRMKWHVPEPSWRGMLPPEGFNALSASRRPGKDMGFDKGGKEGCPRIPGYSKGMFVPVSNLPENESAGMGIDGVFRLHQTGDTAK